MTQPTDAAQPAPPTPGVPLLDGIEDTPVTPPPSSHNGRFDFNESLRERAARGTLINTAFMIGLSALGLVRNIVLAGFLTRADYGLWGVIVVSLGLLVWLKQIGIGDKYIQQNEADQELAFQKAFTLELLFSGLVALLMLAAIPLAVLAYGVPQLVLPGVVVVVAFTISALQSPLWIFYRRMEFARQRSLQAIDPVVGVVVAIALAVAGAGYWAFVLSMAAGACASALAAVIASPFTLRLRFERGTVKEYVTFSGPLFLAGAASLVMVQAAVLATSIHLGLAAVGVIALAGAVTNFTDRVDQLVTGTLYPAVCAVKDNTALLYESFVKSNRLALMWAVPFGIALPLFCSDLVSFGLGERWRPAVAVLQITGIVAAVNHIGFNWTAYLRARAETKPIAVANGVAMVTFLAVGIPLVFTFGLRGYAVGIGLQALVHLACRAWYLQRMFEGFAFLRHSLRAFLPTLPAAAVVLVLHTVESGHRTLGIALGELAIYALVTVAATWYLESKLLREAVGYVFGRRPVGAAA